MFRHFCIEKRTLCSKPYTKGLREDEDTVDDLLRGRHIWNDRSPARSIQVIAEGLLEAEKFGKRVSRIGTQRVNPSSGPGTVLVIDDDLLFTREQVLKTLQWAISPMKEKYAPLFR